MCQIFSEVNIKPTFLKMFTRESNTFCSYWVALKVTPHIPHIPPYTPKRYYPIYPMAHLGSSAVREKMDNQEIIFRRRNKYLCQHCWLKNLFQKLDWWIGFLICFQFWKHKGFSNWKSETNVGLYFPYCVCVVNLLQCVWDHNLTWTLFLGALIETSPPRRDDWGDNLNIESGTGWCQIGQQFKL